MATDTKIKTVVEIDSTQAQASIIKLGATASNSTKDLEERIAAKNEQVELQNALSKQTIDLLTKEVKALEGVVGKEKEYEKALSKLNAETLKAVKVAESGAVAQDKLNQAFEDGEDPVKNLDAATGGLIEKFKLFLANPIGIAVSALVGLFMLFKEAVGRSEKASGSFSIIMAKISGIFNGIIAVIIPLVEWIGDKLVKAMDNPKQAMIDLGETIKENLINRVKSFLVLGDAIAAFFKGNFKEAAKLAGNGIIQMTTGIENGIDKAGKLIESSKKLFDAAAKATDGLAGAERRLMKLRAESEIQMLRFQTLEEKQRQIRDDTSKSIEERIAANKELGRLLTKQFGVEMNLAKQTLELQKLKVIATGETIENEQAVLDAKKNIADIEERITGMRSEQLANENSLLKEKADLIKAAQDAEAKRLEEEAKKKADAEAAALELKMRDIQANIDLDILRNEQEGAIGEEKLAQDISILERKREFELMNAQLTADEKALINAKYYDEERKLIETSEAVRKEMLKKGLDDAINVAGELFGISKELAIAQMIMKAPQAIADVWANAAKQTYLPLVLAHGIGGTALVVAPIIKGLSDIKKARFPGKKSSAGGGGGASISASAGGASGGASGGSVSTGAVADIAANNAARLGVDPTLGANATSNAANKIAGGTSSGVVFSENKYNEFKQQVAFKEAKTTI